MISLESHNVYPHKNVESSSTSNHEYWPGQSCTIHSTLYYCPEDLNNELDGRPVFDTNKPFIEFETPIGQPFIPQPVEFSKDPLGKRRSAWFLLILWYISNTICDLPLDIGDSQLMTGTPATILPILLTRIFIIRECQFWLEHHHFNSFLQDFLIAGETANSSWITLFRFFWHKTPSYLSPPILVGGIPLFHSFHTTLTTRALIVNTLNLRTPISVGITIHLANFLLVLFNTINSYRKRMIACPSKYDDPAPQLSNKNDPVRWLLIRR